MCVETDGELIVGSHPHRVNSGKRERGGEGEGVKAGGVGVGVGVGVSSDTGYLGKTLRGRESCPRAVKGSAYLLAEKELEMNGFSDRLAI